MRETKAPLNMWMGDLLEELWCLPVLLWLAIALVLVLVTVRSRTRVRREVAVALPDIPIIGKARTERAAGVWTPSSFQLPPITPTTCPLNEILPFPYRPFRAGSQHTTMGLKAMKWDDWIEIDSLYAHYQTIREHRIRDRGPHLIKTLPARDGLMASGTDAAWELLVELVGYLPKRYPTIFTLRRRERADSPVEKTRPFGDIVEITSMPTSRSIDLCDPSLDPLEAAALLVQDDLVIMIEGTDGKYYFQAGAVLVPGFWRMEEKIGMALDDIHNSGDVPHYREKLQPSMTRYFTKLSVDRPVWRNNFFFQVIDEHKATDIDPLELGWSETMGGPEDRSKPKRVFPSVVQPSTIIYRSERQTLRRLPRTGAVVFTIRTYLVPLEEIVKEPGVPERLASAVRGMSDETWKYKNGALYGEALLSYLDEHKDKQRAEAGAD